MAIRKQQGSQSQHSNWFRHLIGSSKCWIPIAVLLLVCASVGEAQRRPPNYSQEDMPTTSFSCGDKIIGGYYADPETDCQMFHVCVNIPGLGIQDFKFLCPNDTSFDQENQICDDWYNIQCEPSILHYTDNFELNRIEPIGPSGRTASSAVDTGVKKLHSLPSTVQTKPALSHEEARHRQQHQQHRHQHQQSKSQVAATIPGPQTRNPPSPHIGQDEDVRTSGTGNFFSNQNGKQESEEEEEENEVGEDVSRQKVFVESKRVRIQPVRPDSTPTGSPTRFVSSTPPPVTTLGRTRTPSATRSRGNVAFRPETHSVHTLSQTQQPPFIAAEQHEQPAQKVQQPILPFRPEQPPPTQGQPFNTVPDYEQPTPKVQQPTFFLPPSQTQLPPFSTAADEYQQPVQQSAFKHQPPTPISPIQGPGFDTASHQQSVQQISFRLQPPVAPPEATQGPPFNTPGQLTHPVQQVSFRSQPPVAPPSATQGPPFSTAGQFTQPVQQVSFRSQPPVAPPSATQGPPFSTAGQFTQPVQQPRFKLQPPVAPPSPTQEPPFSTAPDFQQPQHRVQQQPASFVINVPPVPTVDNSIFAESQRFVPTNPPVTTAARFSKPQDFGPKSPPPVPPKGKKTVPAGTTLLHPEIAAPSPFSISQDAAKISSEEYKRRWEETWHKLFGPSSATSAPAVGSTTRGYYNPYTIVQHQQQQTAEEEDDGSYKEGGESLRGAFSSHPRASDLNALTRSVATNATLKAFFNVKSSGKEDFTPKKVSFAPPRSDAVPSTIFHTKTESPIVHAGNALNVLKSNSSDYDYAYYDDGEKLPLSAEYDPDAASYVMEDFAKVGKHQQHQQRGNK